MLVDQRDESTCAARRATTTTGRHLATADGAWDDVLPVFKRSEDYQHGADAFHGVGGEMRVEEKRVSWEILDAWRDAAEECGIPKIDEFNSGR